MAVFKPENVEDFYEIGEILGRYGKNGLFAFRLLSVVFRSSYVTVTVK